LTDVTVAQAAIIEDHVWALMEALGVRDSRKINQRISEAIGTVLDRQRDALPEAERKGSLMISIEAPYDPEGLAQLRAWYTGENEAKIRWVDKQQVTA
jgi:hypothetical protein